jgi:hypothetical protein
MKINHSFGQDHVVQGEGMRGGVRGAQCAAEQSTRCGGYTHRGGLGEDQRY